MQLSLPRLYLMRIGYLIMGVGLAVVKWPQLIDHGPWTLMEGVANAMFAALSILALIGLRYPVQMLPVLLFESLWKLLWLALVAAPAWLGGRLDDTTREATTEVLLVVIILAVIPWPYVVRRYVTAPGDRWSGPVTPAQERGDPARR